MAARRPFASRVFRLGTGQTLDPDQTQGFEVIWVTDPSNGIRYGAINKPGEPPSAAVRRIQKINQLINDGANEFEIANEIEWLNIEKDMTEIFGSVF